MNKNKIPILVRYFLFTFMGRWRYWPIKVEVMSEEKDIIEGVAYYDRGHWNMNNITF